MIRDCGWLSKIRISSRAAYPDAPTIATPISSSRQCPAISRLRFVRAPPAPDLLSEVQPGSRKSMRSSRSPRPPHVAQHRIPIGTSSGPSPGTARRCQPPAAPFRKAGKICLGALAVLQADPRAFHCGSCELRHDHPGVSSASTGIVHSSGRQTRPPSGCAASSMCQDVAGSPDHRPALERRQVARAKQPRFSRRHSDRQSGNVRAHCPCSWVHDSRESAKGQSNLKPAPWPHPGAESQLARAGSSMISRGSIRRVRTCSLRFSTGRRRADRSRSRATPPDHRLESTGSLMGPMGHARSSSGPPADQGPIGRDRRQPDQHRHVPAVVDRRSAFHGLPGEPRQHRALLDQRLQRSQIDQPMAPEDPEVQERDQEQSQLNPCQRRVRPSLIRQTMTQSDQQAAPPSPTARARRSIRVASTKIWSVSDFLQDDRLREIRRDVGVARAVARRPSPVRRNRRIARPGHGLETRVETLEPRPASPASPCSQTRQLDQSTDRSAKHPRSRCRETDEPPKRAARAAATRASGRIPCPPATPAQAPWPGSSAQGARKNEKPGSAIKCSKPRYVGTQAQDQGHHREDRQEPDGRIAAQLAHDGHRGQEQRDQPDVGQMLSSGDGVERVPDQRPPERASGGTAPGRRN